MTTPRKFEGPNLRVLLEQVRDTFGDAAEIVEANRLRDGGVAGFFAKERFEILARPGVRPRTGPTEAAARDSEPRPRRPSRPARARRDVDAPAGHRGAAPGLPAPGTIGPEAGRFDTVPHQPLEPVPERDAEPALASAAGADAADPITRIDSLLDRAEAISHRERTMAGTAGFDAVFERALGAVDRAEALQHADRVATAVEPVTIERIRSSPDASPEVSPPGAPGPGPAACAPGVQELLDRVGTLRRTGCSPARRPPGQLTVVIGEIEPGLRLARRLAIRAGLRADDVIVGPLTSGTSHAAAGELVTSGAEMAERGRRARSAGQRAVALVPIPDTSESRIVLARHMADAFGPDEVRLVVPGTPTPDSLSQWCEELGQVHAVDLVEVESASGVLRLIEAGAPVATVNGEHLHASLLAAFELVAG